MSMCHVARRGEAAGPGGHGVGDAHIQLYARAIFIFFPHFPVHFILSVFRIAHVHVRNGIPSFQACDLRVRELRARGPSTRVPGLCSIPPSRQGARHLSLKSAPDRTDQRPLHTHKPRNRTRQTTCQTMRAAPDEPAYSGSASHAPESAVGRRCSVAADTVHTSLARSTHIEHRSPLPSVLSPDAVPGASEAMLAHLPPPDEDHQLEP